jgi:glycosyltransferase involved in cell wall biosynthesis
MNARGRIRLGVDFHTFDGIFQGSRSHLLGLYRAAIAQAPDIDFVFLLATPAKLRAAHPEFGAPNVQLVAMPHRPGLWRLTWQLAFLQRRHRLDFLHVQYRLPLWPAGPCVVTLHDVLFETHPQYFGRQFVRMARLSARHAVRRARITCTVSEYSRTEIARHYAIDAARVVLTRNAVDGERFHPRAAPGMGSDSVDTAERATLARFGLRSGEFLCMLGRLEPRKNHVALVRAYALLGAGAPQLAIIGQRDFAYEEVFALIERHGLQARVRILEDVDDSALPVLLRHAALMAYPSQAEGFGMPVLEALASGIPVVTSATTSLPEVAGSAAWLVAPDDVGALSATLDAALAEPPAARRARIERGLAHAARFTWACAAKHLLAAVRADAERQPWARTI